MRADVLVDQLFDEWAASYGRGENPDPLPYLERAGSHADDLSEAHGRLSPAAPRNEPTEETLVLARAWVSGASPLVELRASRGVRREEVLEAVMNEFELPPERRAKVKRYYHELESGLLDPAGLDSRLADLLARTLRSTRDAFFVAAQAAHRRPGFPRLRSALPLEALPPSGADESPDEVDVLFFSGPWQ